MVANEINELAKQTVDATSDIKIRIAGIQASTSNAIGNIEKIEGVIHQVEDIVTGIAAAIEEQSAVTKRNLRQALQLYQMVLRTQMTELVKLPLFHNLLQLILLRST